MKILDALYYLFSNILQLFYILYLFLHVLYGMHNEGIHVLLKHLICIYSCYMYMHGRHNEGIRVLLMQLICIYSCYMYMYIVKNI